MELRLNVISQNLISQNTNLQPFQSNFTGRITMTEQEIKERIELLDNMLGMAVNGRDLTSYISGMLTAYKSVLPTLQGESK